MQAERKREIEREREGEREGVREKKRERKAAREQKRARKWGSDSEQKSTLKWTTTNNKFSCNEFLRLISQWRITKQIYEQTKSSEKKLKPVNSIHAQ